MNASEIFDRPPIGSVNYRFEDYLKKKKSEYERHMVGNNITDYAYSGDLIHRKNLDSVPGLHSSFKKICSVIVSQRIQEANMSWLATGADQFPEIYAIGCECAKRLGIGVPNIYIDNTDTFNAYTVAYDDVEPFIVVSNLMAERMSLGELKAVIGHECGHIHNYHGLYGTIEQVLLQTGLFAGAAVARGLLYTFQNLLTIGIRVALSTWSRYAEVTADRASLICCDDVEDVYSMLKKLLYGGVRVDGKINDKFDWKSLKEQMEITMDNPNSLVELLHDHPLSIKRIFAAKEFTECDTFYSWRPDLKTAGQKMRSKEETDERCKRFININGKGDK